MSETNEQQGETEERVWESDALEAWAMRYGDLDGRPEGEWEG